MNFNYRHIALDRFGVHGTAHGLNARVLLILESEHPNLWVHFERPSVPKAYRMRRRSRR